METINKYIELYSLSFLADILSIISFIFSLLVAITTLSIKKEVSNLRRNVLFEKRIKDHIKALESHRSTLSIYLNTYSQIQTKRDIKTVLYTCKTELWNTIKKLTPQEAFSLYKLIFRIWIIRDKQMVNSRIPLTTSAFYINKYIYSLFKVDKDRIQDIYSELSAVIIYLDNLRKDKNSKV